MFINKPLLCVSTVTVESARDMPVMLYYDGEIRFRKIRYTMGSQTVMRVGLLVRQPLFIGTWLSRKWTYKKDRNFKK